MGNHHHHRNWVTNSMKKAKAAYSRRLIVNSGNDRRFFWKTLKKDLPGKKKAVSQNLNINGTLTDNKSLVVDSFNKFFTNGNAVTRLVQAVRSTCASEKNSMQFLPRPCSRLS